MDKLYSCIALGALYMTLYKTLTQVDDVYSLAERRALPTPHDIDLLCTEGLVLWSLASRMGIGL